jgi:hypothetical protein
VPATFVLAANDHPGTRPGRVLLREALGAVESPSRACALGAAHGDDRRRMRTIARALEELLGAPCSTPFLSHPELDLAAARADLEAADVLYLDGGDTLELVRAAAGHGLQDALRAAAARARVVYGLSAGAAAAAPCTNAWDEAGEVARVEPCLDLGIPWPVDVHDEAEGWPEARALLQALAREGRQGAQVLVIPTGAAALVAPDGRVRSRGRAACELRALGPDGTWRVEPQPV